MHLTHIQHTTPSPEEKKDMAYYKRPYSNGNSSAPKRGNPNWNPNYKKSTVVPGSMYRPVSTPSAEQQAIFDAVVDGTGSYIVDSYAGCGKTTACVESMHRVVRKSPRTSQGYLIFAKRNAEEAIGKAPASATIKTAHAFGLQALGAVHGKIQVDKQKTDRIATALVGPDEERAELRFMLGKVIDLSKDYLATTPEEVIAITEKHGFETCDLSESEFADKVLEGMRVSKQQPNVVSFSDMIWLPLVLGIHIPTFDILYADEIQDLNLSRIEIVMRALGKSGRLIGVGDEKQSIFGFSGADRHALAKVKERSGAATLSLHRTYRCGRAIVEYAKQWVPDYEAAATNPEGEVRDVSMQEMMAEDGVQPGDFILSRTNNPTVKVAMALLKQGRRCNIQGRDIGQGLLFMLRRSKAASVAGFQSWLDEWASAEIERLSAKKKSYEHVEDKRACLESFCEGQRDLSQVKARIEDMFDDKDDDTTRVILSSIHKAKGLERDRVYLLESSFTCRPKTEEEVEQEANVRYVGCTRGKNSLLLVG
ncbi:ATP-dependent DNA helicase Rep [uncultured archaeon]|nr:ATP-dependent DNA helicase Rep [uncultured archaeon]